MSETKNYFEQIVENQTKLMERLTQETTTLLELAQPRVVETMDKAVLETYYNKQKAIAESIMNLKEGQVNWEAIPEKMNEAIEANKALYEAVSNYYKETATSVNLEQYTSIYKNIFSAMYETVTANTKVVQDYFA